MGVREEYVGSVEEMQGILERGRELRAVAATGMNEGSSRSHSGESTPISLNKMFKMLCVCGCVVFMISINQRDLSTRSEKKGKLVLVDLAGSEMVRKTHASGQQLEEAKTINKSLSALGKVINALTDPHSTHVPYRSVCVTLCVCVCMCDPVCMCYLLCDPMFVEIPS